MPVTLPSFVAPNELIQSAWGNGVVNALDELDDEKLNNNASDEMIGTLTLNPAGSATGLIVKNVSDVPRAQFQSTAGTMLLDILSASTGTTIDTFSSTPIDILTRVTMEAQSGSNALALSAVTETPSLVLESIAGTDLLTLTAGVANSTIESFDNMTLRANGADAITIDGGTQQVMVHEELYIGGQLDHNGTTIGFYGIDPVGQSTGWGAPTGTATKTTFATTTVTTEQLAQRVKAIIDYLMLRGDFSV